MKKRINACIQKLVPCTSRNSNTELAANLPIAATDVREEYANAFRTQSYNEFWTRVRALCCGDAIPVESSSAARLPSYRIFVEHLLDPDQPTASQILIMARNAPTTHSLLSKYFTQTANASLLCGLLLKDIDLVRAKYQSLKATLQSPKTHFPTNSLLNPFNWSSPSPSRVRVMQADCSKLLKHLESSRDKAKAKLQLRNRLKHCSALFLVSLTASLTVIIATHAFALLVAAPSLIIAASNRSRRLARELAQLDAAAKGTYIVSRDLDTISRLVGRLNDELEHLHATVEYWVERGDKDWRHFHGNGEVVRQLNKNDCGFGQQLDELEEHLYLCFMTINRARNLVLKQLLDPGHAQSILSNY